MPKTYARQLAMQFDALSVFLKSGNVLSGLLGRAEEFPWPGWGVKVFAGPGWKVLQVFSRP
jgi:hypothetical protein